MREALRKHAQRRILVSLLALSGIVAADDNPQTAQSAPPPQVAPALPKGVRRALIVCGLAGDADHHRAFSQTVDKLQQGMVAQVGFQPENIIVLFGDEPDDQDSPLLRGSVRSTREAIAEALNQLRRESKAEDGVWVILMGHAHFDGKDSWLNLPGPDYSQSQFAELLNGFAADEQVLLATIPVSGQWIKPTSRQGRVVISATEPGWETNETEFAATLATQLQAPPEAKDADIDQDGHLTLLDLYLATCRELAQSYVERELLATEHPLLDDNGDGRGTELQIDYLTEELGGRVRRSRTAAPPKTAAGTDGALARSILLKRENPTAP